MGKGLYQDVRREVCLFSIVLILQIRPKAENPKKQTPYILKVFTSSDHLSLQGFPWGTGTDQSTTTHNHHPHPRYRVARKGKQISWAAQALWGAITPSPKSHEGSTKKCWQRLPHPTLILCSLGGYTSLISTWRSPGIGGGVLQETWVCPGWQDKHV